VSTCNGDSFGVILYYYVSDTTYTVVVIRVSPKGMDKLYDKLLCMRWVDERKTTTDKGCRPPMVTMLGLQLEPCISPQNGLNITS